MRTDSVRLFIARGTRILLDVFALAGAFGLAFYLRFDWNPPHAMVSRYWGLVSYVVGLKYAILYAYGIPRFNWRYVSLREALRIAAACAIASTLLLTVRLLLTALSKFPPQALIIPVGVIAIDLPLAFLALTGLRALRRVTAEQVTRAGHSRANPGLGEPTLLVGAGQCGVLVVKEILGRPDIGLKPVGFVDDDPIQRGTILHGVPVLGSTLDIPAVVAKTGATQVLITIVGASGTTIRRITDVCKASNVGVKVIPGLFEVVGGQVNLSRMRDVAIEDLLRREPIKLDDRLVAANVSGRVVLVTGAGGSIGSELCRQVCAYGPGRLVLVERAENNLFNIHRELIGLFPGTDIVPCIADVCDKARMQAVFAENAPHVVIHAAAHKHVPMMEWNPCEAVKNNLGGTALVAELADRHNVERFVLISTDKAVNPRSVMGATKRAAELYIQAVSARSSTRYVAVRFGNVLGSAGSVVPIFKEQIAKGGPITLTHPDMKRYFMTIPEACQLVMRAAAMGEGGEIFILDMGEPVLVADLARDLIRLSGLLPDRDIEIIHTGLRPGEKLFEELTIKDEDAEKTIDPKIFIGKLRAPEFERISPLVADVLAVAAGGSDEEVRIRLRRLVPEFSGDAVLSPKKVPLESRPEYSLRPSLLALEHVKS